MAGSKQRPSTAGRGYGAKWQAASAAYLAAHPWCVMCHPSGQPTSEDIARGRLVASAVVDHIKPHRLGKAINSGDAVAIRDAQHLMWSRSNWQPLCKACHDGPKQRIERSGYEPGARDDGMPIDPGHHWFR